MRRELSDGMIRVEVIVDEEQLNEVQSLLDAKTPSDAVRILISNRLAAERAKRDEHRGRRRPQEEVPEAPVPSFPERAASEEDWKERKEVKGERRWRRSGPVVEQPATDEHPMRAYHRRVEHEEEVKARRGRPGGPGGARTGGYAPRGRAAGPSEGGYPPRPGGPRGEHGGGYAPRGARPGGEGRPSGPPRGGGRPAGPPREGGYAPRGGRPGGGPRPEGGGYPPRGGGRSGGGRPPRSGNR